MIVEAPRRSQTLILDRDRSLFQQMVDDRLALAEQARQCAAQPEDLSEASEPDEDEVAPVNLDSKLIGLHLEDLVTTLDETRKRAERTLRRMQQVMARVEKGQEEALATLRRSLGALASLEVVPPRVVEGTERDDVLTSMMDLHGSETPPDGMVYRLYREEVETSFFVLSAGEVLALKDGTIGSSEDKDDMMSLVMSEIYARKTVFNQGIEDLKANLDDMKQRFVSQLSTISATLKMQRV